MHCRQNGDKKKKSRQFCIHRPPVVRVAKRVVWEQTGGPRGWLHQVFLVLLVCPHSSSSGAFTLSPLSFFRTSVFCFDDFSFPSFSFFTPSYIFILSFLNLFLSHSSSWLLRNCSHLLALWQPSLSFSLSPSFPKFWIWTISNLTIQSFHQCMELLLQPPINSWIILDTVVQPRLDHPELVKSDRFTIIYPAHSALLPSYNRSMTALLLPFVFILPLAFTPDVLSSC